MHTHIHKCMRDSQAYIAREQKSVHISKGKMSFLFNKYPEIFHT